MRVCNQSAIKIIKVNVLFMQTPLKIMQGGVFCILSHLMQQELPLSEKKSATPGFTYSIEELGREKKNLIVPKTKRAE